MKYNELKALAIANKINVIGKNSEKLKKELLDKKIIAADEDIITYDIVVEKKDDIFDFSIKEARALFLETTKNKEKVISALLNQFIWEEYDSCVSRHKLYVTFKISKLLELLKENKQFLISETDLKNALIDMLSVRYKFKILRSQFYGDIEIFIYQNVFILNNMFTNHFEFKENSDNKINTFLKDTKSNFSENKNNAHSPACVNLLNKLENDKTNFGKSNFAKSILKKIKNEIELTNDKIVINVESIIDSNKLNLIEVINYHTIIVNFLREKGFLVEIDKTSSNITVML